MPFANEHACRLRDPKRYTKFRRMKRKHDDKEYSVVRGKVKDAEEWEDQSFRYPTDEWDEDDARQHCTDHDGTLFEPASGDEEARASAPKVPSLREAIDGHVWALAPRYAAALQRSVNSGHVDPLLHAQAMEHHHETAATGSIAVIPLLGVLMHRGGYYCDMMGSSTDGFVRKLRAAAANPDISTILIDCDSPGGMVGGVPEAWQAVMDVRKKKRVIAVANTLMASAAYWICCAAETVIMTPSAEAGSIGLFILHMEMSRMLEEAGVGVTMIRQPPAKADANPFEPLSDAARADLQGKVDETYRAFTAHVAKGRKKKQSEVQETFGQGRTMMAAAAVDVGMVDEVKTFEAVVSELLEESLTARAGRSGDDQGRDRMALASPPPPAQGAQDAPFGCSCGINCQCQDGKREWCDETCQRCEDGCACRQHIVQVAATALPAAADETASASPSATYSVQALEDADALDLAVLEGR